MHVDLTFRNAMVSIPHVHCKENQSIDTTFGSVYHSSLYSFQFQHFMIFVFIMFCFGEFLKKKKKGIMLDLFILCYSVLLFGKFFEEDDFFFLNNG